MKKQYIYFEKERMHYVVAIVKGDESEAKLHLGRMQGYEDCLNENIFINFEVICYLHDRIMSAIDFAYRMRRLAKKNFSK